jgi:hypothetical protein
VCRRWAARFRGVLERNGFAVVPLQSPELRRRSNLSETEWFSQIQVVTRGGSTFGGVDGFLFLGQTVRPFRPLAAIASLPGVMPLLRRLYRGFARHRRCFGGACDVEQAPRRSVEWPGWLPLLLMTAVVAVLGRSLPAWSYMWLLAIAMFGGCKWLTFWSAWRNGVKPTAARAAGYLLAWPGMDAKKFLTMTPLAAKPRLAEWLFALIKTLFGAALVWGVTRSLADFPLRAGWIGMIGIMFVLHFGLLHAVSLAWQAAGVNAPPLMQAPILSVSTGEFWGARWNTGFHQLVKEMLFAPLRTIFGARTAVMVVFLASGLIHELLITVPARGGYGLPTLYFLLQGTAVLCERTNFARSCGLGRGWRGRLFTIAMTAGPAFWLFPPPFVLNVMIPFLKTIHSI